MKKTTLFITIIFPLFFFSCEKDGGGGLNIFSISDEQQLGLQVSYEIKNNPAEYPILPKATNQAAYNYVEGIMNLILSSDLVEYRSTFDWNITIIDADVLNAFAAPGGQLFFYTGFLKYAQSEAELAGVMAHEIAHSDRRHSTANMTKAYGLQTLLSIVMGDDAGTVAQIAASLALNGANLSFSRQHEYQADEYAVKYLNSISSQKAYEPTAIVDFFNRMAADDLTESSGRFEFLRTHPYDDNRKANINEIWQNLGSPAGNKFEADYTAFKAILP
jgi:predicted Zn-dependent protease